MLAAPIDRLASGIARHAVSELGPRALPLPAHKQIIQGFVLV
jgi:hypothetical protein